MLINVSSSLFLLFLSENQSASANLLMFTLSSKNSAFLKMDYIFVAILCSFDKQIVPIKP